MKNNILIVLIFTSLFYSSICSLNGQFGAPVIRSLEEANANPDSVIVLDLSGQLLETFPEEIFSFKNLERLSLNNTFLKEIPEKIGTLSKLKALEINHLDSAHFSFHNLPKSISQLKQINYLGLIGLPNLNWEETLLHLKELPLLDNLALMNNNLEVLPEGIENLEGLRKVWLGKNYNLKAEDVFARLPNIEQVGFGGIGYESLPENITSAPNLFNLWLANNSIKSISELTSLQNLKQLTLNGNKLTLLPLGIEKLNKLVSLSLDNNPELNLNKAFATLSNLGSLKQLSLSNNNLMSIPNSINKLNHLEVIVLRNNILNEEEKAKIKELLPNTRLIF